MKPLQQVVHGPKGRLDDLAQGVESMWTSRWYSVHGYSVDAESATQRVQERWITVRCVDLLMQQPMHTASCTSGLIIHMTGDSLCTHCVLLDLWVLAEYLWQP